ncbi:MAG: coproporphyrinogen III oxidase [Candidatus Omnitrophica bacterium CG_4_10_14_0_2_um_filter_44_9]|nr:MAG: coproporphyrinogen III oxidase [Candidatus Omnitrophica bacterium CG_4_10_14_0_8_um_filter_44_12]PIZ84601.1 MAG: coproporphyrinogen III oxidase [Candidatus Omnitrophica bacterium CG_4_10_14_0_2_um_filter_44_9]
MHQSLYIHIPFCISKCFYCSFVSFENKDELIAPYLEALKKEAALYKGQKVSTVYIGGGTPTHLNAACLEALFSIINNGFVLDKNSEVTIEANPTGLDLKKIKVLTDGGVNRVSLGVQSFGDKNLKWLGRHHSPACAISIFKALRDAGLKNLNLDLIYSLPGQSEKDIKKDVSELVFLGSEHVSLYALAISDGSKLAVRKVKPSLPDRQARHYLLVTELLKKAGFLHYEVSNFAKYGFECGHNVNYWRGGDYIGLGAAAHSNLGGRRFWNIADPETYISAFKTKDNAISCEEKLGDDKRFMEAFLIGLRLTEGVDICELGSRFNTALTPEKEGQVNGFVREGLLARCQNRIRATMSGMVVLDEICSRLI